MADFFSQDITYLQGVGPKKKDILSRELGISTFGHLAEYYPYKYVDRSKVYTIAEIAYLIKLSLGHSERREAYNQFCEYVEEAVLCAFNRTAMEKEKNPGDPRQVLWNACNAFACQLYVRKIYLQEALSGNEEGGN